MKFKIIYKQNQRTFSVNCLINDKEYKNEIEIPDDMDKWVHYPIPNNLKDDFEKFLNQKFLNDNRKILNETKESILDIERQIDHLQYERKRIVKKMREKLNPTVIDICKLFSVEHPEHFI